MEVKKNNLKKIASAARVKKNSTKKIGLIVLKNSTKKIGLIYGSKKSLLKR